MALVGIYIYITRWMMLNISDRIHYIMIYHYTVSRGLSTTIIVVRGDLVVVYRKKKGKKIGTSDAGYKQNGITLTPKPLVYFIHTLYHIVPGGHCACSKRRTRIYYYYFRFTRQDIWFFFF